MKAAISSRGEKRVRNLPAAVDRFVALVVKDPNIESAWLSALSWMEELAARQILGNISKKTPPEFIEEIHAHAADETRHSLEFVNMRPIPEFDDPKLLELESKMRSIAGSFVVGYFGNPLLVTARNRHIAYVHGALTIEQFPYQLYSAYLKVTKIPRVLENLPSIVSDENGHIALGRKMREEISEADRLSIAELNEIEKDMCFKLVERLGKVVSEYTGAVKAPETRSLARMANVSEPVRIAWTHALGHAEALAMTHVESVFTSQGKTPPEGLAAHKEDELRHSRLLRQTVLLARRRHLKNPSYRTMEAKMIRALETYVSMLLGSIVRKVGDPSIIYPVGALALEMRVFRHYSEFLAESDDMGISHALGVILHDEAEHTQSAHAMVKELPDEQSELIAETRELEEQYFSRLSRHVIRAISDFGSAGRAIPTGAQAKLAEAVAL